jgi:hypothetical protein
MFPPTTSRFHVAVLSVLQVKSDNASNLIFTARRDSESAIWAYLEKTSMQADAEPGRADRADSLIKRSWQSRYKRPICSFGLFFAVESSRIVHFPPAEAEPACYAALETEAMAA